MSWHYALNNESKGPVEQAEFDRLVQQGVITDATLVWREGMANWTPYGEVASRTVQTPDVATAVAGGVVCSECGLPFAPDQVIRIGSEYVCAGCKPLKLQKLREGVAADTGAEQIRQEHIRHEASVKSIGTLYFVGAAMFVLTGVVIFFAPTARQGREPEIASWLVTLILGLLAAALISTALGLRRLKPWARIVSGIMSGFGLLGFPLGTLINAYILYLLFSKKGATVFSDGYKEVIAATPHIRYRTSILVWVVLGLLLLLLLFGMVMALFSGAHR